MSHNRLLTIADQRAITPQLRWLTLHAPELARSARAGQYLLVRCAEAGSYDPLLRRPLFIAAAEPALVQIALLYQPDERGLAWLARGRAGDVLDVLGPFGHPFALDRRTRNLLLIGSGPELAALLMLAREGAARGAVTLIAGADTAEQLPPPFLLPGEVEYQTVIGISAADFALPSGKSNPSAITDLQAAISWADQICVALPDGQLAALRQAIEKVKYRWEPGFASALLPGPIVCGVGACGVCAVTMRRGTRMRCADGPVFDLRDVLRDP